MRSCWVRKCAAGVFCALVLCLVLAGSGCRKEVLKVGLLPDEEALPAFVAQQEGLFAKHGAEVELVFFQSAAERDAAVQAGAVDGAEGDLLAVALLRQGGTPVKAVSLVLGATPQEGRFALLAAPRSGITRVSQLRGKKIAISKNTIIEYVTDRMLLLHDVAPAEVTKVHVAKMPLRLEMLLQNQVAAAVLPDPLASLAELKGARVLVDDTKLKANISHSVFFFRDKSLAAKREAVEAFVAAFFEGAEKVTRNPEKYRELFYEKVRVPPELRGDFPVPTFSPPQLPSRTTVREVVEWLLQKELLKKPLAYEELVTEEIVRGIQGR